MARWSKNRVNPDDINLGNEYEAKDRPSREQLNAIVNNSFYASEKSAEALEKADSAFMANGTVARVNGTPQAFLDFDTDPQEQLNKLNTQKASVNMGSFLYEAITSTSNNRKVIASGTFTKGTASSILLTSFGCESFYCDQYICWMALFIDGNQVVNLGTNHHTAEAGVSITKAIEGIGNGEHAYELKIWCDQGSTVHMGIYNSWYLTIQEV